MGLSTAPSDPGYQRSWHELRRRDYLFWLVVLSYVPGLLLIIMMVSRLRQDVPENMVAYLSGAWLAAFVAVSLYRQDFRCPRCRHRFFRRHVGLSSDERKCMYCGLPRNGSNAFS